MISQVSIVRMGLLSRLSCTCIPMDLTRILSYNYHINFCYKPKCVQGSEKSVVKLKTGSVPGGISVWSVAEIEKAQRN